ncbi:Protein of unknown function (DUF3040) [Kineococcus xinjiangensis]|uniref:DUF3040 family protein n=1 Tax=Kineococcus xinjiangensis TaxID=512762 RepID=A0A2S6IDL0_9ACTN|nr:DUF3040 domain-containing protein [Kineococcus xinjiangensis]PPK92276.1 Protein of unknown function (DUF3040) [Kineococcus xinjiangensis]
MLSEEQRRELAAIEEMLTMEDPELARVMGSHRCSPRWIVPRLLGAVAGLALLVAAVAGAGTAVFLVGVVFLGLSATPARHLLKLRDLMRGSRVRTP